MQYVSHFQFSIFNLFHLSTHHVIALAVAEDEELTVLDQLLAISYWLLACLLNACRDGADGFDVELFPLVGVVIGTLFSIRYV